MDVGAAPAACRFRSSFRLEVSVADAAAGAVVEAASADSVAEGAVASEGLGVVEDSVVAAAARAGRRGKR